MAAAHPLIKQQAELYLQIQHWLGLEASLREAQAQVERATALEAAAEIRAQAAITETVLVRAELAAANERIATLLAKPEGDDEGEPDSEALTQANATIAELRAQLQRKAADDAVLRQAIEAGNRAAEAVDKLGMRSTFTEKAPEFDIIIARGTDGLLKKLTVKEKE